MIDCQTKRNIFFLSFSLWEDVPFEFTCTSKSPRFSVRLLHYHNMYKNYFPMVPPSSVDWHLKVAQSCLTLSDPWTIQSMEFSRPEYWSIGCWRWCGEARVGRQSLHRVQGEILARGLTPSCRYSLPRGQKAEVRLTMNLWMRVWKVFIKLWRTSEENESQKPLYHIWYQSVVWFYWWPGICLVYWADIQTYQPYDKDWIKEKIYMLFQQAQQAGTFGSIMGTGVGLEHRCG